MLLGFVPPWLLLSALLGVMHGALFHLLFGNQLRQLPVAVLVGMGACCLGGLLGLMIPPALLEIGDTNLIATTAVAWLTLGIARLFRFC